MASWLTKKKSRVVAAVVVAGAVLSVGSLVAAQTQKDTADNAWPYAPQPDSPILAAVGDISCQPDANASLSGESPNPASDTCDAGNPAAVSLRNQAQDATANEIESMTPSLVAILGDEQYQIGSLADFEGSYDQTYGAFKFLQRPSPGNHEFYSLHHQLGEDGIGYFDYFNGYQLDPQTGTVKTAPDPLDPARSEPVPRPNGQAGPTGEGWYSYDLGSWHIISLNAECSIGDDAKMGACDPPPNWYTNETTWLANDLAHDHTSCTLAYWHQPTFSVTAAPTNSTTPGPDSGEGTAADAWWKLLQAQGADVVLNGHEHVYARSAPMDPNGQADPQHGIRQFIIGTGGEGLDPLNTDSPAGPNHATTGNVNVPNLEAAEGAGTAYKNGTTTDNYPGAFGIMKLTLGQNSYSWDYESAAAPTDNSAPAWGSFSDTGSAQCHGPANGGEDSQGQNSQ